MPEERYKPESVLEASKITGSTTPAGTYETHEHKMTDYYGLKKYIFNNRVFYAFKKVEETLDYLELINTDAKIKAINLHRKNALTTVGLRESKHMIDALTEDPEYCRELKTIIHMFLRERPEYLV